MTPPYRDNRDISEARRAVRKIYGRRTVREAKATGHTAQAENVVEMVFGQPPTVLYHSAPSSARHSIRRHGLLRSKSETHQLAIEQGETDGPYGGIFFASKPIEKDSPGADLWQVDVRGLHLVPDDTTDSPWEAGGDTDDTWWVTYTEDVPPSRLKLMRSF